LSSIIKIFTEPYIGKAHLSFIDYKMEDPILSTQITKGGKGNPSKARSRKYVFTLNNYTEKELAHIENFPEIIKWVGYEKEICPTTGTPHLQGFLYCHEPMNIKNLNAGFLKRARLAIMRGEMCNNDVYCSKGHGKLTEFGERPMQVKRTAIIGVKRRLDAGENLFEIKEDENFSNIVMRNERALTKYAEHIRRKLYNT
jgi:hypothetical protein